jgi:threonine dehydrogenase-like Zn-dependent dehydrogenase
MAEVAAGVLDASVVMDSTVDLEGVPDGYVAMDSRKAIKVRITL